MSNALPLLHDLQMGVARGVNAQFVIYLFFRITDRQKFVEGLPSAADTPEREDGGSGLGIFHSEAWYTDWQREKHVEAAALGERRTKDEDEHLRIVPCASIAFTYSG